jgi:DNA-binding transcriptional MerR regulator
MTGLRIGALARRTGTTAPTIRYYEEIGLLHRAGRHSGGHRVYSEEDVRRLFFIRRCREFGFFNRPGTGARGTRSGSQALLLPRT